MLILFFIVAFMYSSVGHGGASGYLAIMAIFSISPLFIKSSALIMNLFVSSIAFYSYYKAGHFKWKIILPFLILSVPLSFIGAKIPIDPRLYKIILALCLLIAVFRLFLRSYDDHLRLKPIPLLPALIIGGIIGLLSGMIGIGGGIILSPLLLIARWATIKETAAVAALFILFNSFSGLLGLLGQGIQLAPHFYLWILVIIIGGLIGSYAGALKLSNPKLRYILATVLFFAIFKLFFY